eukprot:TRINITY_DN3454_c0_g3_i4.p3 TRINITY_DN3454_c0_g3~~TRINITY_DN3454_c0_g3_i4.p3  ORF type:complete len:148 (-),score=33.84 TRINITY_DN3454_c0_g3_i4:2168-2611(-)
MAVSNTSSMQGSKSDEDFEIYEFSDAKQDADEDYQKLFLESVRMSKISEKRSLKLKAMEEKNASLQVTLIASQSKVSVLENQSTIVSNKLLDVGKENECLKLQLQKFESDLVKLQNELASCKKKKEDFAGKLRMTLAELNSARASIT